MTTRILRIDASARTEGSVTREITDRIAARFAAAGPVETVHRDLSGGLPQIDGDWIAANFTPAAERSEEQRARLALSDSLVAELAAADVVLIGLPIYNFGVPASLKAWVDLVARAGVTFRYTEAGPEGLLKGKRAIVTVASGGTPIGSDIDFATGYITHVLGFLGITDVEIVKADRTAFDAEAARAAARQSVEALPVAA